MTVYQGKHKARIKGDAADYVIGNEVRDVIVTFDEEGIKLEDKTSALKMGLLGGPLRALRVKADKLNLNVPYGSIVEYKMGRDNLRRALLIKFTNEKDKTKTLAIWAKDRDIAKMVEILQNKGAGK